MMNPYKILGAKETDSKEVIKKKYRKLANINHPDKGGAPEKMAEIAKAWEILSNPKKRKEYDETGKVVSHLFDSKVDDYVNQIFTQALMDPEVSYRNLMSKSKQVGKDAVKNLQREIEGIRIRISRYEEIIEKKCSIDEDDSKWVKSRKSQLKYIIDANIQNLKNSMEKIPDEIKVVEAAVEKMKQMESDVDEYSVFSGYQNFQYYTPTSGTAGGW